MIVRPTARVARHRWQLWLCCLVGLVAASAGAESRRIESVGAAPLGKGSGSGSPREQALTRAVDAAVLRVAGDLLPPDFATAGLPPGADAEQTDRWLTRGLGEDRLIYATRYSILEDRGERPAVFSSDPAVRREYVVLASVEVDVEAVREQLRALGALEAGSGGAAAVRLVVEGLERYRPLGRLREALEDHPGVRSVTPVEFTPGRAVLAVVADREARELVADLEASPPEGLQLIPVETGASEATLLLDEREPDHIDTPGGNR